MTSASDPRPKLDELEFEELMKLMGPKVSFHSHRASKMISGFDREDIAQELWITLWRKLPKARGVMEHFDYRFTSYMDKAFYHRVIDLHRRLTYKKGDEVFFRDELNRSVPLMDDFDEVISK